MTFSEWKRRQKPQEFKVGCEKEMRMLYLIEVKGYKFLEAYKEVYEVDYPERERGVKNVSNNI